MWMRDAFLTLCVWCPLQVIVDVLQGQFRSHLTCPECCRESRTFDAFAAVPCPLPDPPPPVIKQGGGGDGGGRKKKGRKDRSHRAYNAPPPPPQPPQQKRNLSLASCLER
jgi:hypothetical protein